MSDLIKKILIVCVWYFSNHPLCIIVLLNDSLIPAAAWVLRVVREENSKNAFIFKDWDQTKSEKRFNVKKKTWCFYLSLHVPLALKNINTDTEFMYIWIYSVTCWSVRHISQSWFKPREPQTIHLIEPIGKWTLKPPSFISSQWIHTYVNKYKQKHPRKKKFF